MLDSQSLSEICRVLPSGLSLASSHLGTFPCRSLLRAGVQDLLKKDGFEYVKCVSELIFARIEGHKFLLGHVQVAREYTHFMPLLCCDIVIYCEL